MTNQSSYEWCQCYIHAKYGRVNCYVTGDVPEEMYISDKCNIDLISENITNRPNGWSVLSCVINMQIMKRYVVKYAGNV